MNLGFFGTDQHGPGILAINNSPSLVAEMLRYCDVGFMFYVFIRGILLMLQSRVYLIV